MFKFLLITAFLSVLNVCIAQNEDDSGKTLEEKYEWRIRQESLFGTYIPKDINEAILVLTKLSDAQSKQKFKAMSESDACQKLFFSLGRWMSYNWSFYEGSRLSVYLQELGIHHPDNMSRFLIVLFHRSLSNQPLEVKELVTAFINLESKSKEEKLKGGTVIYQEKKKLAKPSSGNN